MVGVELITTICVFSPLVGSLLAGLLAKRIGPRGAQAVTIAGVFCALSAVCALIGLYFLHSHPPLDFTLYPWLHVGSLAFQVGFLVDRLSILMAFVVTFISLLVHIYSMGYMKGDKGYQRFFSYVSLFTFAMLMLVMANNCMQLFFGWEGVGVVSYLLIGFWFHKESAAAGSLKAFLVNRVGDFGFLLGLAILLTVSGSLDYRVIFVHAPEYLTQTISLWPHTSTSLMNVVCFCLFIGAMGKSAQIPLHVWLPESMEGPTPISALIHAATMVTAGIYLITRMSPLFEQAPAVLNIILCIGATGALLLGLVGIVQNDIKRVVAYSTLSQLGYMIAATGASAYAVAMFHLVTHAFFKALLFLGAGSVIVACHHEQDMRKMGGLRRYMPVTFWTFLIGTLALTAIPPFAGFYSKDAIIEAVSMSGLPSAKWGTFCLQAGAFVTALYSFRALFMTFFGKCRYTGDRISESPWTICLPLFLLAVGSMVSGYLLAPSIFLPLNGLLSSVIYLSPEAANIANDLAIPYSVGDGVIWESVEHLPLWLTMAGFFVAYYAYILHPGFPAMVVKRFGIIYKILMKKFGFDAFNDWFFVQGLQAISAWCYRVGDKRFIDTGLVQGSANRVLYLSCVVRHIQSGFLYHYTFSMVAGLAVFLFVVLMV